jgi:hypothetical protein
VSDYWIGVVVGILSTYAGFVVGFYIAGVEPRRGSDVGSDPLLGVSDPCKTCSDRDKPDDEDPCAMCGPPAWEYHDSRCDDDVTPNWMLL